MLNTTPLRHQLEVAAADLFKAFRQRLDQPIPKRTTTGAYSSPTTASGTLANSLRYVIQTSPRELQLLIFADRAWRFADRGRPAGRRPPVDALLEWSFDKGLDFQNLQARRSFAFALARKIGEAGTAPTRSEFYQRNMPPWADRLPARIRPALRGWVAEKLTVVFKDARADPRS